MNRNRASCKLVQGQKLFGIYFVLYFLLYCEIPNGYPSVECKLTFLCNGFKYKLEFESLSSCPYDIGSGGVGSILETRLWLAYYPKTDIHGVIHPNRCRILEAFFDSMCKYWAGKR